ncbi:hypothetical protein CAEBREN_21414 [Caenorhabditis brenneri]|uniref:B box-type domain-containing protein n=1 Tax=Caenorhabditis brenneri TaxID=135651 RepID=G0M8H6_CAEBE|nr:hypothetical protein CAEBREN_21414 [Caenorhabditis brenneri]
MDECEFVKSFQTDQPFIFKKSEKITQTFNVKTRKDWPVDVCAIEKLPPGYSISSQKIRPNETLVSITYDPFENSVVRVHHGRGTFCCGIKYKKEYNLTPFNISLNFEEDDSADDFGAMHCPICLNKYDMLTRIPLVLWCGHTMCKSCLEADKKRVDELNNKKKRDEPRVHFCCCLDKKIILSHVSELPKNFVVFDLLREEKQKEGKFVLDPYIPCFEDGNHEATKWCEKCEQSFCDRCYDDLHRFRAMTTHKAVPVAEKPIYKPKCSGHPDQNGVFCCLMPDCPTGEIFCDTCLSNNLHDGHLYEPLEDIVQRNVQFVNEKCKALSELCDQLRMNVSESFNCHESFKWYSKDSEEFRKYIKMYYKRKAKPSLELFEKWRAKTCEEKETEHKRCVRELKIADENLRSTQKLLKRKNQFHHPMLTGSIGCEIKKRKTYHPLNDYAFLPGSEGCPKLRSELDDDIEVIE